jgi:heparan-alpha-glucosaminide N-acetyltransferase
MSQLPKRLLSIDVLRAVTMFLMLFVNDADGIKNIPGWIGHARSNEDALGFADTIFPAFLLIVGLSLPFAINNRIKKGDTPWQVLTYILIRSAALLIMGFYHVNLESYDQATAPILQTLWALIITVAFFLIWLDYPETLAKTTKNLLIGFGLVTLLAMAVIYKGCDDDEIAHDMRPGWWGILGIIGWAYLVCAVLYYLLKGKLAYLIGCWAAFIVLNIVCHSIIPKGKLWLIGDGSSVALVMGGIVISGVYAHLVERGKTQLLWATFSAIGVLLLVAGFVIRPYAEGISKIHATPAWVFICSGITILVFQLFIYLVDVRGNKNLFSWIRPAGTSTLTCYLMPYFQVFILKLFITKYPAVINTGAVGLLRSVLIAFALIVLVGLMEKKHLRLKI